MRSLLSILALTLFSFTFSFFSFSQIQKLKENADKAKEFITAKKTAKNFSKTLFVNPFIGTGGHGHTYPGASAPFGMMQLSPDTRYDGWDGCGGYHYSDSIIYGFSHTHLSGTGVSDYADLLITPQVGKPKIDGAFESNDGYGHRFSHNKEKATPGFYSVELLDANILAEFTVDLHSGLHKYTFNGPDENKYILLDLDYRDELISAGFETIGTNKVKGHRISKAWAEEQHFYFHLESNVDWKKAKFIRKKGRNKLLLKFPKDTKEIILRVGISAVDTDGAKKNLDSEIDGFDFVAQRVKTGRLWEAELSKIYFDSDKETTTIFYTALYHSFLAPNIFSDVDSRYRGMDKKIHQLNDPDHKHYTVFSLWDTFRATHPLFTLTQEKKTNQFIRTFQRMQDEQNDLPVWELAGNETECMIGYHSVSVIADAYIKGLRNYQTEKILKAMVQTSRDTCYSKDFFSKNGYLSLDLEPESVSKALEYAYDDFCISAMANAMNKTAVGEEYAIRSLNFINHFHPENKFFRARRGAMWMSPFAPDEVNFNFTEANAWQYSLFTPHAIGVLTQLHGGKNALEQHLDNMFTASSTTSGRNQADITGLIGQYAHGNEPSHHMAYLYNHVNKPEKTQLFVDSILYNLYSTQPDGLSGNEDCGQMSSWYVLSAMGIYPIAPGSPYYEIGRPIMNQAIINLENGNTFKIRVNNQSRENKYIQKIELNGKEINRTYLTHNEMVYRGELVLTMGDSPSESMRQFKSSPTISKIPKEFTPIPYLSVENRVFIDEQKIDIRIPIIQVLTKSEKFDSDLMPQDEAYSIEYKMDDTHWQPFVGPFTIKKSCKISTRTRNNITGKYSATVSSDLVKKNDELRIHLITPFTLPYASGGENALIDGIQGNKEFRTGDWQGFYGFDVKAEIQFKQAKTNFTVELGMLEDLKSWIFYPTQWTIEISSDGVNFEEYKTEKIDASSYEYRPANIKTVLMDVKSIQEVKAIRITVKNAGECPDWHLGAGNPSWIFLDEISIH